MTTKDLIMVTGMSGSGKTFVSFKLQDKYPEKYKVVVSTTTRPKRSGEVDGVHYHFVKEFPYDSCIQTTDFGGYTYGVDSKSIESVWEEGFTPVLVISPDGLEQVLKYYGVWEHIKINVVLCQTEISVALQRMADRGDSAQTLSARYVDMYSFSGDMEYLIPLMESSDVNCESINTVVNITNADIAQLVEKLTEQPRPLEVP